MMNLSEKSKSNPFHGGKEKFHRRAFLLSESLGSVSQGITTLFRTQEKRKLHKSLGYCIIKIL